MTVALVLAILAALVFAALWLQARRAVSGGLTIADDLRAERDRLANRLTEAEARVEGLETVNAEQVASIEEANAAALEVKSQVEDLSASIESERAEAAEAMQAAQASISDAAEALETATSRAADLETRNAALVDDRDQLQARLDDVSGALSKASERPDVRLAEAAGNGTIGPDALWELELSRAERRWRHSVAPNPEADDSPFDAPGVDAARLAVETEAAALREEVGAFITVEWKAAPIQNPSRALLVSRMAQEILANAAREPEATHLVVEDEKGGNISIRLLPADAESEVINLIAPPRVTSDRVEIANQGTSLDVTVKAE